MCCQIRSEQVALHLKIKQQHEAPQQHGKLISRYKAGNFNEKPGKSFAAAADEEEDGGGTAHCMQQRSVPVGSEKLKDEVLMVRS